MTRPEFPKHLSTVFAVICATPARDAIGAVYFGYDALGINRVPLLVLDWSISSFYELTAWLPQVSRRVTELTTECGSLNPTQTIYVEPDGVGEALASELHGGGHEAVEHIPEPLSKLTLQERAIGISPYVARGLVIVSRPAHEKESTLQGITRNHLMAQITSFGITADDPEASELFSAYCLGILLALEDPPRKSKSPN